MHPVFVCICGTFGPVVFLKPKTPICAWKKASEADHFLLQKKYEK